jgi:hypothetical protein
VAIEPAVDEMQVAGAAAAGADGEAARDMGVGASREGGDLLVADMQPFDALVSAKCVGESVETVADDAVNALDACLNHLVGDALSHPCNPWIDERGSPTINEIGRRRIGQGSRGRPAGLASRGLPTEQECATPKGSG